MVALTDSAGAVMATYSYSPYGEITSSTGSVTNPYRFGGSYGAYTDVSTGLLKLGQRYYDPALGRWTQPDPLLHLDDPQQWNRYAYVAGNPVNFVDPSGTEWTFCSVAGLATGIAGMGLGIAAAAVAAP